MPKRALGFGMATAAVLTLVPSIALAGQQPPYSGNASTATLSVFIAPTALVAVPSSLVNQQLPSPVSSLLTTALQPLTVQVDSAHSSATRTTTATDLSTGHADVTPLSIDLSRLGTLLDELHSSLDDLAQGIVLPALQSTLADVGTVTSNSTVMGLLPSSLATALTALDQQLASLNTGLATLSTDLTHAVDDLNTTVHNQLGSTLALTEGLSADLDSAHPHGQNTTQPGITVPQAVSLPADVPSLPVSASLSPFVATAVNLVGAQQFGVSGPQASSNESSDSIGITPSLDLATLQNDVSGVQATLQQVSSSITTIVPLLAPVAALINTALPGGLDLTTLQGQVTAVAPQLGTLLQFVDNLQINSLLSCDALGTGACSIASTSVTPQGTGLHAVASSKVVGLSVLPMSTSLATALQPLGAQPGTALLDVQGLQATADTVIDATSGSASATGTIAHVAVAGLVVVDRGVIDKPTLAGHLCGNVDPSTLPDALPIGVPVTVCLATPAGELTLMITAGQQQKTYSSATHRNVTLALTEVRLIDGGSNGANPVGAMGLMTPGGTVATVDADSVATEVLAASTTTTTTTTSTSSNGVLVPASPDGSNVVMEKTGMFGPLSVLAGLGLLGGGLAVRCASRRRRRAA
jgi:hypothetical protein